MPTFGFGIRPRGPEHLTETADERHHVRRGDAAVEIDDALLHLLDEILGADHVGAGLLRFLCLGALGEHGDAQLAARSVGQLADAAHHLIGMARIDAEIERNLDRLVELRLGRVLDELHRLFERIELVAIDGGLSRGEPLAGFGHGYS